MKKTLTATLLLLALLLAACGQPGQTARTQTEPETTPTQAPESPEPTEAAFSPEEIKKAIDAWQQEPCSFTMRAGFLSQDRWGLEEKIDQECGKDGSIRFSLSFHSWNRERDWEKEDLTEYHYAVLEGGNLLCTTRRFQGSRRIPDGPIQRYQMGEREQKELFDSWQQMLCCAAMLPDWAEELSAEDVPGSPELLCLRYRLPLDRVLQEESMLKQLLSNLFLLREIEEPPKGLMIDAELYLQRDSLRPDRLRYSFGELAAIFSEADNQNRAAQDTAGMEVEYLLDHELAETVPLPEILTETEELGTPVRGAKSLDALNALFNGEELFTPGQVRCMGYEMLMACLTACDEEKGLELLADFDPEAIADYLNENFFEAVKLEKFRYEIRKQYNAPISEEVTQQTLEWFESQKGGVIAQYGEENYRQILEETAGQQEYTLSDYTMRFADGSVKQDGYSKGNYNGFTIVKSNGRYFWSAFDLFESLTEEEEMIPSPLRGTVEDGWYTPAELGLRVRVEDWRVGSREEISQILYGDASYASAMPEGLLANGLPYGDLMIQKDSTTAYFLLVLLPVRHADGAEEKDLDAYMDSSEESLSQTFSQNGVKLISLERTALELGGRSYEMIRVHANGGIDQFFTLLGTEENGKLYLVNINCLEKDDTDEILSRFEALP